MFKTRTGSILKLMIVSLLFSSVQYHVAPAARGQTTKALNKSQKAVATLFAKRFYSFIEVLWVEIVLQEIAGIKAVCTKDESNNILREIAEYITDDSQPMIDMHSNAKPYIKRIIALYKTLLSVIDDTYSDKNIREQAKTVIKHVLLRLINGSSLDNEGAALAALYQHIITSADKDLLHDKREKQAAVHAEVYDLINEYSTHNTPHDPAKIQAMIDYCNARIVNLRITQIKIDGIQESALLTAIITSEEDVDDEQDYVDIIKCLGIQESALLTAIITSEEDVDDEQDYVDIIKCLYARRYLSELLNSLGKKQYEQTNILGSQAQYPGVLTEPSPQPKDSRQDSDRRGSSLERTLSSTLSTIEEVDEEHSEVGNSGDTSPSGVLSDTDAQQAAATKIQAATRRQQERKAAKEVQKVRTVRTEVSVMWDGISRILNDAANEQQRNTTQGDHQGPNVEQLVESLVSVIKMAMQPYIRATEQSTQQILVNQILNDVFISQSHAIISPIIANLANIRDISQQQARGYILFLLPNEIKTQIQNCVKTWCGSLKPEQIANVYHICKTAQGDTTAQISQTKPNERITYICDYITKITNTSSDDVNDLDVLRHLKL